MSHKYLLDTTSGHGKLALLMLVRDRFTSEIIAQVNKIARDQPALSRNQLSKIVCEWLKWTDPNGHPKVVSCRLAMLRLQKQGRIDLPAAQPTNLRKVSTEIIENYDWPEVQGDLTGLGKLELVKIERGNKSLSRLWNVMMDAHHYLGAGPLCGAQIRYLIKSDVGWIGGLSFSSSAWKVKPRDNWIDWTDLAREKNLARVINNSRFLILPSIVVPNLASHILAKVIKQLPDDWYKRYGYKPLLLETFVQKDKFLGTSYKASNWQHVGETQGRGRQDVNHEATQPIKHIFLYPLSKNFREELCQISEAEQTLACAVDTKTTFPKDWAEEEFGSTNLGDMRLDDRLLTLARDFYARPQANIPQACQSRSRTKAAYRFFDNKNTTLDNILKSHSDATTQRIAKHSVVLSVQDTTTLNYSAHPATNNIGPIGSQKDGPVGLIVHDTMAYNLQGTPLGLIDVQWWARDPDDFGKKVRRHKTPIEEKESYKWLKSLEATNKVQKQCQQTTLVSVGDRESDIYELFTKAIEDTNGPKLLVRAEHNRSLMQEHGQLWEHLASQPLSGIQELQVPRQGNRKARVARMEVRFAKIKLKPPKNKTKLRSITLWAVWTSETNAPANVKPLEWMLLTTIEVKNFEEACEKLAWYALRWGIEVYHRTLKSGCKIEQRQLGDANRLEACLAIDMVVAWRIYHLAKLGRETPDVPCTVYFQEEEWKALSAFINKDPVPPKQPPTLRKSIHMVASLGGFLGRKGDGEPGTKTLWLGLQRLDDITTTWKVLTAILVPDPLKHIVPSKLDYG